MSKNYNHRALSATSSRVTFKDRIRNFFTKGASKAYDSTADLDSWSDSSTDNVNAVDKH